MPFNIDPEKQCPELIKKLPKPFNILISLKENKYIKGFLIEKCLLIERLEKAFEKYFLEEVLYRAKRILRETGEPPGLLKSRLLYLNVFKEGLENAYVFDSGRDFSKIYLLTHLKQYKKLIPEIPQILVSVIPDFPKNKAEELKLKIFYGLGKEIEENLNQRGVKAKELWQEILKAPQYFLEKDLKMPKDFPWPFGEVFYGVDSEKIKRIFSDAIIQGKDFLNSKEGKKIIFSFFKKEISLEEALCCEEILDLLPISSETLNFMKKLSLNLRYGEVLENFLENIYFCEKKEESFYLEGIKLDEETKPLKFSLAGVINPVVNRYLFLIQIKDLEKVFDDMVLMDAKAYKDFLKEKEDFEIFCLEESKGNNVFFEKYLKNGVLFSSRGAKSLFEYSIKILSSLSEKENKFLNFKKFRGYLWKGSFYLLPFYFSQNEARHEIVGSHIDENLNFLEAIDFDEPFLIMSNSFLETLSKNIEINSVEIFETKEGNCLKINFKNFCIFIYPFINDCVIIRQKKEGKVLKVLDPNLSLFKINELVDSLKNF